jgi:MoxR-like ATPase
MIVESEAGTGKNFKCDILGHLTNREVFDISCNEHMEKEDLLFSPEINNDGTFRRPSKLVQGLQTPGAIIVLDEVNTLKPGVSKLLNPLLDGRRYINDAQLGKVHAHPTVLIVGLMNPRYYRGTRELPQEQISRAIITSDEYSQSSEEAFLISKYLDGALANLTSEEFENYRNQYVIKGDTPNNKTVSNTFLDLDKVVKVAKKVREEYSKTMKGDAEI